MPTPNLGLPLATHGHVALQQTVTKGFKLLDTAVQQALDQLGSENLPAPGEGSAGKLVAVTAEEDGFELIDPATAADVSYDNQSSGLSADNVQDAVDEVAGLVATAAQIVEPPAAADSTGSAGQIAYDSDFLYVCIATDTWLRVAIATWP